MKLGNIFKNLKKRKSKSPKMKRFFAEKMPKVKTLGESEYERICDKAIYESISSNGSLTRKLEEHIRDFDAQSNPITSEQAKRIIYFLLKEAVAERAKLMDSFVEAAKNGEAVTKYKSRIDDIQSLIAKANVSYNDLDIAEDEYDEFKENLKLEASAKKRTKREKKEKADNEE